MDESPQVGKSLIIAGLSFTQHNPTVSEPTLPHAPPRSSHHSNMAHKSYDVCYFLPEQWLTNWSRRCTWLWLLALKHSRVEVWIFSRKIAFCKVSALAQVVVHSPLVRRGLEESPGSICSGLSTQRSPFHSSDSSLLLHADFDWDTCQDGAFSFSTQPLFVGLFVFN